MSSDAAATSWRSERRMLPKLPSVLLMLLALACGDDALAAGSMSPAAQVRLFASRRSLLYAGWTLAEWAGIAERMETGPTGTNPPPETRLWRQANRQRQTGDFSSARATLHAILGLPSIGTPAVLAAWRALRDLGEQPDPSFAHEILGVVVEFADDEERATISIVVAAYAHEAPQLVA